MARHSSEIPMDSRQMLIGYVEVLFGETQLPTPFVDHALIMQQSLTLTPMAKGVSND